MNIKIIAIGKTDQKEIENLMQEYIKKTNKYISFTFEAIPDIKNRKNLSITEQKKKEGALLISKFKTSDYVVLLDEKGKTFTSISFSKEIQKRMNSGIKQLIFVIGGPYGFDSEIYQKAQSKISISSMTFSHQMVRLFICEQIYRAFNILNNTPYHHE